MFLGGRSKDLQERLKRRMYEASESESFEVARYYRDLIRTIEKIQAEQRVASASDTDADLWGVWEEGGDVAIAVFVMRDGNLVDRKEIFWEKVDDYSAPGFLSEVLQRFYEDNLFIPAEVLVPVEVEEQELIEAWLTSKRARKVAVRTPRRGAAVERLALAGRNARLSHLSRFRKSKQTRLLDAARRLGEVLGLEREIERIESFDISNIQGTDSVAGMVVFANGRMDKSQYRVFNIRTVEGADDFRSIAEAVTRRYRRVLGEGKAMPDLILIDGGRGQLNAAVAALEGLDCAPVPVAGLAKREEEIYLPGVEEPLRLDRHDPALQLLQVVRDETHRFAVGSHRKRRTRRTLTSELDELAGIGEKRRRLLLEHFGGISAVRQASQQDLVKVLGARTGRSVWEQLHESAR
jgi:excinuclease ABC subunit C